MSETPIADALCVLVGRRNRTFVADWDACLEKIREMERTPLRPADPSVDEALIEEVIEEVIEYMGKTYGDITLSEIRAVRFGIREFLKRSKTG